MTIRDHLSRLEAEGFFELVMAPREPVSPRNVINDFDMFRAKVAVAFPLTTAVQQNLIAYAWQASQLLSLCIKDLDGPGKEFDRAGWEAMTQNQETVYMSFRQQMEEFIEKGELSPAQVEFMHSDVLGVSFDGVGEDAAAK
jgi:hypothetical protein